jgi:hypothetical protein
MKLAAPVSCPACGEALDQQSRNLVGWDAGRPARPGDFALCAECGAPMTIVTLHPLTLRTVTPGEAARILRLIAEIMTTGHA